MSVSFVANKKPTRSEIYRQELGKPGTQPAKIQVAR